METDPNKIKREIMYVVMMTSDNFQTTMVRLVGHMEASPIEMNVFHSEEKSEQWTSIQCNHM